MSEEERQRQMDFILNQQAQFAADLQRSREEQEERWRRADERWARTEGGIRALLTIAELHGQEIAEQSKQIAEQSKQIAESREAARETDKRLDALINTVESIISERRNGGPQQG